MSNVCRAAWLGSLSLHRSLGLWIPALVLAWILATRLQEPEFFRRQGIPFYWANVQALLIAVLGLLPLLWRLAEGSTGRRWLLHPMHRGGIAISFFSIVLYGFCVATFGVILAFSVDRIMGGGVSVGAALCRLASALAFLCSVAALAPVLLRLRAPITILASVWLVVLAAYVAWFQPLELLTNRSGFLDALAEILPVLQATFGGLLLSVAVAPRTSS